MIPSYSSIVAYGHKSLESLFEGTVYVTEKCDGSQFSFRKTLENMLEFRSKNAEVWQGNAGMFSNGVRAIIERDDLLVPEWIYRGEYLQKPHHNALCYSRVPNGHVILFDVDTGDQDYLCPVDLEAEARRLDLECVPCLYTIKAHDVITLPELMNLLEVPSILGGQKVEGIVLKNYAQFGRDHKTLMAKLVRKDFQEVNRESWRKQNPPSGEFMSDLAASYCTQARWMKAVQHLRESGDLEESPRDIPNLMQETARDVLAECEDELKDKLFAYFWKKHGSRAVTKGLPDWYKQQLAERMSQEIARELP
jgi:hypothetical protein